MNEPHLSSNEPLKVYAKGYWNLRRHFRGFESFLPHWLTTTACYLCPLYLVNHLWGLLSRSYTQFKSHKLPFPLKLFTSFPIIYHFPQKTVTSLHFFIESCLISALMMTLCVCVSYCRTLFLSFLNEHEFHMSLRRRSWNAHWTVETTKNLLSFLLLFLSLKNDDTTTTRWDICNLFVFVCLFEYYVEFPSKKTCREYIIFLTVYRLSLCLIECLRVQKLLMQWI